VRSGQDATLSEYRNGGWLHEQILVNRLYGSIFQNPDSQKGNVQEYIYKNFQNNFQNNLRIFLCSFFSMKIWDFSFSYWYKKHLKLFVWFGLCGRSLLVSACSPQFDLCKCRSLFFQMEVIIFSNGGHYFLTFGSGDKKHT